jgi:hypothetical protein
VTQQQSNMPGTAPADSATADGGTGVATSTSRTGGSLSPKSAEASPTSGANANASLSTAQAAAITTQSPPAAAAGASPLHSPRGQVGGRLEGNCVQCGEEMGKMLGSMSCDGPLHNECIVKYRLTHVERCAHCDRRLEGQRMAIGGIKVHPDCVANFKAKIPFVKRTKSGLLKKFSIGRSGGLFGGSKNWKERFFLLDAAANTLSFYESEAVMKQGKPTSGAILLDKKSCRLITRPMKKHHSEASNVSREFVLIFKEKGTEQRLLCQSATWEDHDAWCDVLHDYICTVDAFEDGVEIVR